MVLNPSPTLKLRRGSSRVEGGKGSLSSVKVFSIGMANFEAAFLFLPPGGGVVSGVWDRLSSIIDAFGLVFFLAGGFGPTTFGDCLRLPGRWDLPDPARPGMGLGESFASGIWIFWSPGESSYSFSRSWGRFWSMAGEPSSAGAPSICCRELDFFSTLMWILGVTDPLVLGDACREVISSLVLFSSCSKRAASSSVAFFLAAYSSAAFFFAAASSSAAIFLTAASSSAAFFLAASSSRRFCSSAAFLFTSSASFRLFPIGFFFFGPFKAETTEDGFEPERFPPVSFCFSPEGLIFSFTDKKLTQRR